MTERLETDRNRRRPSEVELQAFLRGIEPGKSDGDRSRRAVLKLRSRVRLALYIVSGLLVGFFLIDRLGVDALTLFALFALWVFLGIPACCKVER